MVIMQLPDKVIQLSKGMRLPYFEYGSQSEIPVVLLHGFAGSRREYEPVFAHLPRSIHAFALTQRGHGDAGHPKSGYRLQNFSADLAEFMQAKEIPAAVIAGHSMGSAIAQRFAVDNPDLTQGLVLASAAFPRQGDPGIQDFFDTTVSHLKDPINPLFVRQFLSGMRVESISEELFEILVQEALKVPARVWIQAFEGRLAETLSEQLKRISCPTLLIWGEQDQRSLRSDQDILLATIPDSRLIVYHEAGHLLHLEEPQRFASNLTAFVEELAIGAAS